MSKLVTIGIPTYNRAEIFLPQALESAMAQTYDNLEIIVSDNCSSDHTETLVREYADPRIKYVKQNVPLKPLQNSNFCLNQANGEYFLQLHDDDLIDQDFIESCMRVEQDSPNIGVIRTGVRVIDAEGIVLQTQKNVVEGSSLRDFFLAWFENKTSWYLCNSLFQTKGIRDDGGFHSKRHHVSDGVAIAHMAHKYGRKDIENVKASFRQHSEEITFSVTLKDWCLDYHALLEQMYLSTNYDEDVKTKGAVFFSQMNYHRADTIQSRMKRLLTFLMIYRLFYYSYPPEKYIFPSTAWKILRTIKKCASGESY